KRGGWSKKADFGVNTSEFWSNENFKREQAAYDEGAINLFAPSLVITRHRPQTGVLFTLL
ncbi:hypothetical protein ACEUEG_11830, partial [Aeromonas media]|uniref:hypothetical protein n=1 Tax=Aeromonas media TaxID=651 RepID=UPI0038CFBA18